MLGIAWSLVNPLALMAVYLLVFGVLYPNDIPHYSLYLLAGLACWIFFATSLQAGARSLLDSAELIGGAFPAAARCLRRRRHAARHVCADARDPDPPLARVHSVRSLDGVARFPLGLLFAGLVTGVSLIVACLNVLFRDVEHILAAALLPWFFVTPILWRFADLPAKAQGHHKLLEVLRWGNFVAPPIYAVRDALWLGHAPRAADVVYLAVAAVLAMLAGALLFRWIDDRIAIEL